MEKYTHSEPYVTLHIHSICNSASHAAICAPLHIIGMLLVYKHKAQPELAVYFVVEL